MRLQPCTAVGLFYCRCVHHRNQPHSMCACSCCCNEPHLSCALLPGRLAGGHLQHGAAHGPDVCCGAQALLPYHLGRLQISAAHGMYQVHKLPDHSVQSICLCSRQDNPAGRQRPAQVPAPPTIQCAEPLKDLLTDTCSASCLAMPKSASLRRPVVSTSRLAPLMSRCTVCWL